MFRVFARQPSSTRRAEDKDYEGCAHAAIDVLWGRPYAACLPWLSTRVMEKRSNDTWSILVDLHVAIELPVSVSLSTRGESTANLLSEDRSSASAGRVGLPLPMRYYNRFRSAFLSGPLRAVVERAEAGGYQSLQTCLPVLCKHPVEDSQLQRKVCDGWG